MHPSVVRDGLGAGRLDAEVPDLRDAVVTAHEGEHIDLPEGVAARVQLSPERVAMAGRVHGRGRLSPAGQGSFTQSARSITTRSRRSRVVARTAGYIEKLYVDKTYTPVAEGEPLAMLL